MGTGIKGFKSQKILKTKLNGYTEDQSIDPERYATIQELTGDKHGIDTISHGVTKIGISLTAAAGSNIRTLKATAHGASKGDQVRFVASSIEASVLSTPDANTIILGSQLSFDPTGLLFDVLRHVTPLYGPDGSISVSSGSITFVKNSITTTVNEDSSVPANNAPLPSAMMIKKDDGNYYPVTLDTTNPYQHTPIPVCITDVSGTTNVTINAGDIAVGIKHNGADPSSVRIGDGTNLAAVSAANALKVDGSAVTQPISGTVTANLGTIDGVSTSANQTNGTQLTQIKSGSNGNVVDIFTLSSNPSGGDKALLTSAVIHAKNGSSYVDLLANASSALLVDGSGVTQPVSLSSIPINAAASTSSLQTTGNSSLSSIDTKLTNVATTTLQTTGNNSLSSIDGKLPASLGAKAGTASLSVVPATDASFKTVEQPLPAATITTIQLTVGLTAVRATVAGTAPGGSRKKLWIKPSKNNLGAIYIGSSGVLISTGMEIIGPDRWEVLNDNNDYYLISDTAGQVVEILEVI